MKTRTVLLLLFLSVPGLIWGAPSPVLDFVATAPNGHPLKMSDYQGKWVLVNYWATWCGDCIAEMPALSRLAKEEPQLAVLGLTDETLSLQAWQKFLSLHPVSYPVAAVRDDALPKELPASAYALSMRPISYLIAPDGKVVRRFLGKVDTKKVKALIGEYRP